MERYDKIILSPGPGIPRRSRTPATAYKRICRQKKPILGVCCLGHQAIGEAFGGKLENLKEVHHGAKPHQHYKKQWCLTDWKEKY